MSSYGRSRSGVLTVVMNLLVAVAIALALHIVIQFFGGLARSNLGEAYVAISQYLVIPFALPDLRTPYGGVFDLDATATMIAVLLIEWFLSVIRGK